MKSFNPVKVEKAFTEQLAELVEKDNVLSEELTQISGHLNRMQQDKDRLIGQHQQKVGELNAVRETLRAVRKMQADLTSPEIPQRKTVEEIEATPKTKK